MLTRSLFSLLFLVVVVSAARIKFFNYCPKNVFISQAYGNLNKPVCKLNAGFYCYLDVPTTSDFIYFQNDYRGVRGGHTRVLFNINHAINDAKPNCKDSSCNSAAVDEYAVSTSKGFDYPVQISSTKGGQILSCDNADCPDVYNEENNKEHLVKVVTGGDFHVLYCPYNEESLFKSNSMKLVESINNIA